VENTNQLYLIGMMGSGKSSTAKALSLSLGWNFIDIDDELTKSFGMSINELFLRGEENFRKLEFAELQKHILKENTVIAVGGGAVSYKDSYELLSSKLCIYLKTSNNILLDRLKDDSSRPLLNVQNKDEIFEEIMLKREQKYETLCKIEVITDHQTIQDNCNQIMEIINVQ
jgi:shikimate kinase